MKTLTKTFIWLSFSAAATAYAAPADGEAGGSLLGYLFLGFFALIIISQLIPAGILFCGIIKGVFSSREGRKAVE